MANQSIKALLHSILADDIEQAYISITERALTWAVAGLLDNANYLLEELWKYKLPHSRHLWLPDEGLQIMWAITGKQPANIPFELKDIVEIETENWSSAFYPIADAANYQLVQNKSFSGLDGHLLFLKANNATCDGSAEPSQILDAFKRLLHSDYAVGHTYYRIATCGALLAAKNQREEEAAYFVKSWGLGYQEYWMNYALAALMRDRSTAALLLTGILAPVFKVTPDVCNRETHEVLQVLATRMTHGRALTYGKLSWKKLLDRISNAALDQRTFDFPDEVLKRKSLRYPPASKQMITAIEKRLGQALPEDYKEFLLVSNGFECFASTGVQLMSIELVDYLRNVDEELVEIWTGSMEEVDPAFSEKFSNSIIIGGIDEEQKLLLVPLPQGSYECWYFSSWNPSEVVYPGFRFYMEEELNRLETGFYAD